MSLVSSKVNIRGRFPRQGVEESQKQCANHDEGDDNQVDQHAEDIKGYLGGTS